MDGHPDFLVLNAQVLICALSWQPRQLTSVSFFQLPFLVLVALFLSLRPLFCIFLLSLCLHAFSLLQVSKACLHVLLLETYVSLRFLLLTAYIFLLFPLLDASLLILTLAISQQMPVACLLPVQTFLQVE